MEKVRKELRRSIALTAEMEEAIVKMRMQERFTRMSYAEIIRLLIQEGLDVVAREEAAAGA